MADRIILIGPSGSGKSSVSALLAAELGYDCVDTDSLIEERVGMPVFEIFARIGEPAFRALETETLKEACARRGVVVATGGGIVLKPENWEIFRPGSAVIGLMAEPETLVERIDAQTEDGDGSSIRPLLAGNPIERIRGQLAVRGPLYAEADITVDTEGQTPEDVAARVLAYVRDDAQALVPRFSLAGATERSDIYIQGGLIDRAAMLARRRWPKSGRVWIVADENVAGHWGNRVEQVFRDGGFEARQLIVPSGEASKSFAQVERLCREMTAERVSRRDLVVALGGGVAGDLAGLVASICLRGLSLIQMPTSLLAMVDSSVGGKTGINTEAGKNLVGTFNQPGLVLIDPEFLTTLPAEEYRSGMAEVIKHSLIQPSTPLGGVELRERLAALTSLSPIPESDIEEILTLNVAIKHSVVQADERESGLRMILNFGHTSGHAIEADGYRYRHGEAVGLGMLVAARIAKECGRVDRAWIDRLESLLQAAGLPTRLDGSAADVIGRLSHDKKNINGTLHWILPDTQGGVESVTGIATESVQRALHDIGAA